MTRIGWLVLVLVAVAGACAPAAGADQSTAVAAREAVPLEISVVDAAQAQAEGALVVDVRQPDEWAAGHVPGATLIPLGDLAGRASELPRDRTIVVICRSGNRSAQGRDILLEAGFPRVTSAGGGMTAWAAAGLPIETGN